MKITFLAGVGVEVFWNGTFTVLLRIGRAIGERIALMPLQVGLTFRCLVVVIVLVPLRLVLLGGFSHYEVAILELADIAFV